MNTPLEPPASDPVKDTVRMMIDYLELALEKKLSFESVPFALRTLIDVLELHLRRSSCTDPEGCEELIALFSSPPSTEIK